MSQNLKAEIKRALFTIMGAAILAIGTGWVLYAGEYMLFSVGLTGTLQVFQLVVQKFGVDTSGVLWNLGTLYLIFNIPLLIISYKHISKKFTYYSMLSIAVQSAILLIPSPLKNGFFDLGMLEIALTGGIMIGIGVGISMKVGSSTGGFDILFQYLSLKTTVSFDTLNLYINSIIVVAAVALKDWNFAIGILTFIRLIISVITTAQTNRNYNLVSLSIYTNEGDKITKLLLESIGRGVSVFDKMGGYTKAHGNMIYCVMNRYEMKYIKKLIFEADPKSLVVVTRVEAIFGNFAKKVMA